MPERETPPLRPAPPHSALPAARAIAHLLDAARATEAACLQHYRSERFTPEVDAGPLPRWAGLAGLYPA